MADQIPPAYSTMAGNSITDSDVPPPIYTAPTQFNIGSRLTPEPLVNISQVKGHLALLHAFAELKKQVEEQEAIPHMPADLERRWTWFVALAVERSVSNVFSFLDIFVFIFFFSYHRFDFWCHGLQSRDAGRSWEEILPPIDVMMVHDYKNGSKKTRLPDNVQQGLACLYVESHVRAQIATEQRRPLIFWSRWYAEDCMRIPACQILGVVGARFATALVSCFYLFFLSLVFVRTRILFSLE